MIINETQFNCTTEQILDELIAQLRIKQSPYLQKGYKRSGDHLMIQCPYHADGQEHRPSAGIRDKDGVFHCFSCGTVHSLPEVISHCLGYGDVIGKEGFKWLIKNFATVQVKERKDVELDFRRIGVRIGNERDDVKQYPQQYKSGKHIAGNFDGYVTDEELDKYRYTHPYMYKRGLTDEIIELFDIGYDKERDCITFPVRDIYGNCLFVATRSVKEKYYRYPKGVEKPLYGLYELVNKPLIVTARMNGFRGGKIYPAEIIVCEGMFDALTCWVYGKYAVALNGTGTALQFQQLRNLPCRKLILATDNDRAGQQARAKIINAVSDRKLITQYILPDGRKDINELSREEFDNLEEIF